MTRSAIKTLLNGVKVIISNACDFESADFSIDSSKIAFDESLKEKYNGANNAKEGFEKISEKLDNINEEAQDFVILKDIVNNYNYVVQMREGGLISRARYEYIRVLNPPHKLHYFLGETFDPTGMIIGAVGEDGTDTVINDYTYISPHLGTLGEHEVTIRYTDCGK
jgi:hypothetical protein